jgi:hypothetical protein
MRIGDPDTDPGKTGAEREIIERADFGGPGDRKL